MAKAIPDLKIAIDFQDKGSQALINKLVGSLTKLQLSASGARPNIKGLRTEILAQGNASVKSVSSINAQRSALSALRDEAKLGGKTFNQLTQDIKKLDAQLGKTQKARGGARQATQVAGAVISGGIFGGPEGALGAVGGAALGGVEGAFAGAAIGAQIKGLRDLMAGAADYASQIEKLDIALKGVTRNTAEYNSAIETAQKVTDEFNIPQKESVKGITRLAAAVIGAKGPIEDAELTFKNITAAIKATGGSSEDVQGAITAMVQVFSKGKVSAEELSGQLGERLPGAVTMFAEANKMTLPELQKNLKAGTVGLNELMNFIEQLGVTYEGTAREISQSNADAGARLTVAVQQMQAEVGKALIPIGADFQTAFAAFIKEITPFLVTNVPKLGKLFVTLAKNLDTVLVSATAAFAVFAPVKIAAIIAKLGGMKLALEALKGKLVEVGLANPFTALAIAASGLAGFIYNAAKEQARFNDLLKKGSVAQFDAKLAEERLNLEEALTKEIKARQESQGIYGGDFSGIDLAAAEANTELIKKRIEKLERARTSVLDTNPLQGKALDSYNFQRFDFKYKPVKEDGEDDNAAAKALERRRDAAAEIVRKLNEVLGISQAQNEVEKLLAQQSKERSDLKARFARLQKGGLDAEIQQQQKEAEGLLLQKQRADLTAQTNKLGQKTVDDITKITDKIKQKFQSDQEYKRLLAEGITPELAKQLVAINQQFAAGDKLLQQRILDFQAQLDRTELSEQEIKNIEEQIRLLEEKRKLLGETATKAKEEATTYQEETSNFETFKNTFKAGIEEMGNLYENLGNAAASAFSGMADVVADFVTTGTANFKEFARSVLADLSRIFIRMAFFQAFQGLGFFSNGGVVNKGTTPPTTLPGSIGTMAANGLAIGKNGIMPFAKGGVITKPTLFKYADGGSGRFGLMGEAGSEAIMPLRRGRNGKLGVESSGGVGNVVVNVDASGSSVEGDQPSAKLLGALIGAAVQSELIKQKRPGGLLS